MYPVLWTFGHFIIPTWHVLFLVASVLGFLYLRLLAKRFHPELQAQTYPAFLWAYTGALVGARLLSVVIENEGFEFAQIFNLDSLTFYGGFLGACFFLGIWSYAKGLKWGPLWDLMIPPLFFGLAIGRIGCFFNGDDYGLPVANDPTGRYPFWSVSFPNHPEPIPRYPVQLIESFGALLLSCFLTCFFQKLTLFRVSLVGSLGILSYCTMRFFLEYYRDDSRGWFIQDRLSTSQGLSVMIGMSVLVHYAFDYKKHRKSLRTVPNY